MKLVWSGTISYGFVIPIQLYQTQHKSFICRLIHNKCFFEIKELQWCDHCNERIKSEEIIKQISCGRFKDNIKNQSISSEFSNNINILELVESGFAASNSDDRGYPIIPAYIDSNYFLFLNLIETLNKVALGKICLEDKEYFCLIRRVKNLLYLTKLSPDF